MVALISAEAGTVSNFGALGAYSLIDGVPPAIPGGGYSLPPEEGWALAGAYGYNYAGATAEFYDDFIIYGSGGSVTLTANLLLSGTLAPGSNAWVNMTYNDNYLGGYDFTSSNYDYASHQWVDWPGAAAISYTIEAPVNQWFELGFLLDASSYMTSATDTYAPSTADFLHTLRLNPASPFTLPSGYTLTSEGGTPTGTAPEPSLLFFFGCAGMAAAVLRPRRPGR